MNGNVRTVWKDETSQERLKPLNNPICGYRNCNAKSTFRLYFPLGFSALFCQKCTLRLIKDGLANELPRERYEELFSENEST